LSRLPLWFLTAAILAASTGVMPEPGPIPEAVELRAGIFILRGGARPGLYQALRRERITHLIDLRRDEEISAGTGFQMTDLQAMKIQYMRYATSGAPTRGDLDFIRDLLNHFPKGSRIVVTCVNGNRAAGALCPWLVLDQGQSLEEALAASRRAGLHRPETEAAVRGYLKASR
jgi:hypothetical protein